MFSSKFQHMQVLLRRMYFIKASSELTFTGQQPCLLFADFFFFKFFLLYIAYDSQQIFIELINSVVGTIPFASHFLSGFRSFNVHLFRGSLGEDRDLYLDLI